MNTSLKDATDLIVGKYHPIAFAVYALLLTGIESSEYGEYHFTTNSLLMKMSFMTGRRPTRVHRGSIRRAIDKFWEDGIFDFCPHNKGNVVRVSKSGGEWKTIANII